MRRHAPVDLRRIFAGLGHVLRAIAGAPDYERYLAHATSHHPDGRLLTRDEFARQREESRYSRPGSRCC